MEIAEDFGSVSRRNISKTRVVFATRADHVEILEKRSTALEKALRHNSRKDFPNFKEIHQTLFTGLCPELPIAVGNYRGLKGSVLENAEREVRVKSPATNTRANDPCMPSYKVVSKMDELDTSLIAWLAKDLDRSEIVDGLSNFTHQFFHIHPFLDGNGHVWRATVFLIAARFDLTMNKAWTIGKRPYDSGFSTALQIFPSQPSSLQRILNNFISN